MGTKLNDSYFQRGNHNFMTPDANYFFIYDRFQLFDITRSTLFWYPQFGNIYEIFIDYFYYYSFPPRLRTWVAIMIFGAGVLCSIKRVKATLFEKLGTVLTRKMQPHISSFFAIAIESQTNIHSVVYSFQEKTRRIFFQVHRYVVIEWKQGF